MNEFMKKYTITLVANNSGREKNLVVGLKVPWDFFKKFTHYMSHQSSYLRSIETSFTLINLWEPESNVIQEAFTHF
jgi:hypothetical protein